MAFDATYLTQRLGQATLHGTRGLIGGAYMPEQEEHAFIDMDREGLDVKAVPRAQTMLEFLVWDPCGKDKLPLSVCMIPMEYTLKGVHAVHRGCWTMLNIVGKVLANSGSVVKGLTFDAHGSHEFIRRCIHGTFEDIDMTELKEIPFFSELKHYSLPHNCLPWLPIKICYHKDEVFWCVPGACRLSIY